MQTHPVATTLEELAADADWVRRLARSLVGDPAAGDDLAQDAYVMAAAQPRGAAPLRPWLVTVLRNLRRTRSRAALRRAAREHAVAAMGAPPATPAELVGRVELHRLLSGLVLELPEGSRDVVLLHYFEGLSSSEIGARLGLAAGTVRWRLKQALDELRAGLDRREPNRAWVPALAALGAPERVVSGGLLGLVAAAIVLLLAAAWIVGQVRSADDATSSRPGARRSRAATAAAMASDRAAATGEPARTASSPAPLRPGHARVRGRVTDSQDRAVGGADVTLDCTFDNDLAPLHHTRSDAAGSFAFDVDASCHPSCLATKGNLAGRVVYIFQRPDEPVLIKLRPRLTVAVLVVDDTTGAPLPDVAVTVDSFQDMAPRDRATTDADGRATLQVVRSDWTPFQLRLTARAADHVFAALQVTGDVSEGMTVARMLRLARGIAIRGTVLGPDGAAVHGVGVGIRGPIRAAASGDDEMIMRRGHDAEPIDDEGRFSISVARAGRYELLVWGESFAPAQRSELQVELGAEGRDGVQIHLVATPPRGVTGVVVDAAGVPVAGAEVSSLSAEMGPTMAPVVTDARGQFVARSRAPRVDLVAHLGDQASESVPVELERGVAASVTLRLGPAGIAGVVVDSDGVAVPSAQVWLNDCCDNHRVVVRGTRAITDDLGRFAFDVPRGDFVLSVRRSDEDDFLAEDDRRIAGGSRDVKLVVP